MAAEWFASFVVGGAVALAYTGMTKLLADASQPSQSIISKLLRDVEAFDMDPEAEKIIQALGPLLLAKQKVKLVTLIEAMDALLFLEKKLAAQKIIPIASTVPDAELLAKEAVFIGEECLLKTRDDSPFQTIKLETEIKRMDQFVQHHLENIVLLCDGYEDRRAAATGWAVPPREQQHS